MPFNTVNYLGKQLHHNVFHNNRYTNKRDKIVNQILESKANGASKNIKVGVTNRYSQNLMPLKQILDNVAKNKQSRLTPVCGKKLNIINIHLKHDFEPFCIKCILIILSLIYI